MQPMPTRHTKLKIATRTMSESGIAPGRSDPRSARQFLYSTEPMYTARGEGEGRGVGEGAAFSAAWMCGKG